MFLRDPEAMHPDTKMFYGMTDPYDRASLIEYLRYLKETPQSSS